jgi:long-chain acyl-CoA synthetase
MTTSAKHVWLDSYPPGLATTMVVEHTSPLSMLARNLSTAPHDPAIRYFDGTTTWLELDRASDALAALLLSRAFRPRDRLALVLQNNPAFLLGLLAAWKAGGIAVLISPMSKERELRALLTDSKPAAMLALDDFYEDVAREVLDTDHHRVHTVVTVSPLDGQTTSDPRMFGGADRRHPYDTLDLETVVRRGHAPRERPPLPTASDVAVLAYTSGTTGEPKGAMLTHGNLSFNAQTYRDWTGLDRHDPVLALAPVFHVSGLVGGVMLAVLLGSPVVLAHRFEPSVLLDVIREVRPAFALASITAFLGLADDGHPRPGDMASFRWLCSGGSTIEPHVADRLESVLGHYIHNVYGQTETTSPSHAVPVGVRAPIDESTGALSVGLPVFHTSSRVVDEDGVDLPPGEIGEIITSGPQVVPGYWRNAKATAEWFTDGALRTGDVGFMDEAGWFYVVDRRVDLINAAGFKVWPREVERVMLTHPDVREVAVLGIPDEYRGESVKAFVALRAGADVTEVDLIHFCRERLAAYKYPREIELVEELPRTLTGKISRRELRRQS